MLILTIFLAITNLAMIVALFWYKTRVSGELASLRARADSLDPEAAAPPPDMAGIYSDLQGGMMAIEILNPMELAAQESWFAGLFGSLAPATLRRLVYDRASKVTTNILNDFGVESRVEIHHGK